MFKKIEIWVLYLTILLSILFAVGYGALVRQELVGSIKAGWISKSALTLAEIPININTIIKSLDYDNKLEDRFPNSDGFKGTPNDEEFYLLLSRYDGDLNEGIVELVDLRNFKVLYAWNPDIDAFNDTVKQVDEFKYLWRDGTNKRQKLEHPKLTKDGGLLFNSFPLRKINSCSDLVLQNTHDQFHHSIETDSDGNIWAPSHLYPQTLPVRTVGRDIIEDGGFKDDAIVKLSSDGKIIYEKSVSQILIDNDMSYLVLSNGNNVSTDPIHLNDIQPVNFDGEFWKKGDVFISLRNLSMVMLYRPSSNLIIWMGTGPFLHQHDVDILDNHRISVFNNRSVNNVHNRANFVDGNNEVIIYDFKIDKYSSFLRESLIENDVRTIGAGRSEILPNGELFIEETDYGRTLFFNSDGSLRWTHVNRAENGTVYTVGWSRILYTPEDIQLVKKVLTNTGACNE